MRLDLFLRYFFLPFLIIYILFWLNQGIYNVLPFRSYSVLSYLFFLLFGVCALLYKKEKYLQDCFVNIILWITFVYYFIFVNLINYVSNSNFQLLIYLFIVIAISGFQAFFSLREKIIIFSLLIFDYFFVGIRSYIALTINPEISRFLAGGYDTYFNNYDSGDFSLDYLKTIGSYAYFNNLGFITFVVFALFIKAKGWIKIFFLLILLLSIALLIKSAFTTILLIFFYMIFLYLITLKSQKYFFLLFVLSLLGIFVLFIAGNDFLVWIASADIFSQETNRRLLELSTIGSSDIGSASTLQRISLAKFSLTSFLKSPLLGYQIFAQSGISSNIVGEHSSFFDFLGLYGLFSFLLFFLLYRQFALLKQKYQEFSSMLNVLLIGIFFISCLNPIFTSQFFVFLYILLPFSLELFSKKYKL